MKGIGALKLRQFHYFVLDYTQGLRKGGTFSDELGLFVLMLKGGGGGGEVLLLVGCLTSQQHASVSQGRI